jgi:hypothetical protein
MGSWSVYCELSNITINAGDKCVLLPIISDTYSETRGYSPATLPIFGEYNDYGGIENIEVDENTKLIEEYYGISIMDFCTYLLDGVGTYDRAESQEVGSRIKYEEEAKNMRFMWINREVYDFMAESQYSHEIGHLDLGGAELLDGLGFNRREDLTSQAYNPVRFSQCWEKDGVILYSDGSTLCGGKGMSYIYYVGHGCNSSLEKYIDIPENYEFLSKVNKYTGWRVLKRDRVQESFSRLFGDSNFSLRRYASIMGTTPEDKIFYKYVDDLDNFGDRMAELYNIRHNAHAMSKTFTPYKLYTTPQCGEYEIHQKLLEKFCEINKSHIEEEEEEYV